MKKTNAGRKSTIYSIEDNDIVLIHKKLREMYYSSEVQPGTNFEIT